MTSIFGSMDYPFTLTKKTITEGYYNSSGVWIPQTETSTTFSGHISAITEKELQFLPESVRETGARRLAVDDGDVTLKNGDKIQVTEFNGTTTMWYIVQEIGSSGIMRGMGINRRSFYISLTKNV